MTDFTLRISLDASGVQSGANKIRDGLEGVSKSAKRSANATNQARNSLGKFTKQATTTNNVLKTLRRTAIGAFAGFSAFRAGQEFIRLSDQFTQFNNRLQLVTSSQEELETVQAELIRQAKSSFVSLSSQAEVFQRVSRGAGEFGFSQQQALQATDALAKAVRLSGVDAQSAASALVQLGQGIAAGALRGQELNSVLEQTPRVAQAIADALEVSVGQLKVLGEEGAISVEKLIPGLIEQIDQLDSEIEKLTPTVDEAFTNLATTLTVVVGDFNAATGTTEAFSGAIKFIEGLLPSVASSLLSVAENLRQFWGNPSSGRLTLPVSLGLPSAILRRTSSRIRSP
jgi:tape measure domain-containing protein